MISVCMTYLHRQVLKRARSRPRDGDEAAQQLQELLRVARVARQARAGQRAQRRQRRARAAAAAPRAHRQQLLRARHAHLPYRPT